MLTVTEADQMLAALNVAVRAAGTRRRGEWLRRLAELPARDVLRLDERARVASWRPGPLGPSTTWTNVDLDHPDGLAAAVAGLHPDGRLRERAVAALARRRTRETLPFLAMRVVDHVPQVRDTALAALLQHTDPADGRLCLPVLHAVRARRHGDDALRAYWRALAGRHGREVALHFLDSSDRATRRTAYLACLDQGLLPLDAAWKRLRTENDQFVRRLLYEHVIRDAPAEQVRGRVLHGPDAEGRMLALQSLAESRLRREDLSLRLLDRSARVREVAQWRARVAKVMPGAFYQRAWRDRALSPSTIGVVLDGLRETGSTLPVAQLRECLSSGRPSVRLAALKLWPGDGLDKDLLLCLITDGSPKVARAAADRLTGITERIGYRDCAAAAASPRPWTRRAAWRVRRALGPWDRLRADLELLADPEPAVAAVAAMDLHNWLTHQAAVAYARPTGAQRSAIEAALDTADLAEPVRRSIRFHAGLPASDRPE